MRSAYNEVKIKYSLSKNLLLIKNGVSSVACSAGFASCKTFGKQPKHPCFGAKPTKHIQPFMGKGVFGKDAEIRTH